MSHILFRNKIIKELKGFTISNFFRQEEVPEQDFDKDIDTRISQTLIRLNDTKINSITIPISVTENFLEFSGLRLGHHIRLSQDLKFRKVALIFFGTLEEKQLLKISPLANILLTPNVYYVNLSKYHFNKVEESIIKLDVTLGESFESKKYIDGVIIKAPANYQSHHNIDNEVCLLRWSQFLGISEQIPEVKNNLKFGLYFKYASAINPIKMVKKGKPYLFQNNAKILLIDDQSDKGWKHFYDAFFMLSKHQIKFETLDIDFQLLNASNIIINAQSKIENFDPEVVLLDLRLSDSDFDSNKDPKKLTGNKVLEKIKLYNRGIQVIIITASNKVWNYEVSLDFGCNGYIIKNSNNNVSEDIKNLKSKIDSCINRASYLKQAYKTKKSSSNFIKKSIKNELIEEPFGNELIKFLEISLVMFERAKTNEGFAYAYLSLFKCLELIVNSFVFEENNTWKMKNGDVLRYFFWNEDLKQYSYGDAPKFKNNTPSAFQKSAALGKDLWSYKDDDIKQIYYSIDRRNKFIHPPKVKLNKFVQSNLNKIYDKEGFILLLNQLEKMMSNF
jgi:DNA-binding NarL/FixJ family response regulator